MNQPTPAIVAQSAVRRLPRVALLLLCAAYLMPGLLGRGPWKSADIAAFGYMAELARTTEGLARWLDPMLLGLRPETPALIPYWIGAWAIKIAPTWVHPDLAVRIAFALLLWGTFTATWYAVYYLARTTQAQPVAFAFGGEARPTDYARAIADGALLALIACLGLAQLGHETTPALAQLFFSAQFFYGVAALPYRRLGPMIALLVGTSGMTLSGGPTVGLALGAGCVFFLAMERRRRALGQDQDEEPGYSAAAIATIVGATVLAGLLAAWLGLLQWKIELPGSQPGETLRAALRSQAKLLLWFTWPAWPLAVWTLWRWRRQLGARHVALPLWFALVPLAATWTTNFSERSLLLALPAFATLAAFALPTFRRSVAALIDWFTLLFFSGTAILIWVIWIAMQTGFPAKTAANVAKLAPGFVPHFSITALLFAIVATLAWAWLVRWRTGRHRAALWKTLVLPGGGAALCWMLLMTLWLPVLDYARSYAPQVRAIVERVGQPSCMSELALSRPHIAALRHHGQINLQPLMGGPSCPWLVVSPEAIGRLHTLVNLEGWRLIGTLRRPTSPSDDLLLYQRTRP
ncbi:UDP phosphate-alpha-4-amino-4-deoxy-L-arabinose arabinosyl transferase [Variovorax defluvii]|uniref:UDP phosphate-alpha-4-amino-4-deoxy-L-arabinose arabinosyl transferase n=1 Tax=Variovorax defluvii TaxID=913761 RepID=A0ABP8HPT8_9BURK